MSAFSRLFCGKLTTIAAISEICTRLSARNADLCLWNVCQGRGDSQRARERERDEERGERWQKLPLFN